METKLGHIQFNIAGENRGFYEDLFEFLEWPTIHADETVLGVSGKNDDSLWFISNVNGARNDYDGAGMNHIGIQTSSQSEVDETVNYLEARHIQPLFETPRHRPEFAESATHTYYQVMFESPDRILFEVVYTGPKQ